MTAIDVHDRIDDCIKGIKQNVSLIKIFLNCSKDSKLYFFSRIDEGWLSWIWTNGFLVDLKKPAENPDKYSYDIPELEYLSRMAEKDPAKVAEIISSIPVTSATFNHEVISRFTWIIQSMPVDQIKNLVGKIRDERWVYLMRKFGRSAYEFDKMVKKLFDAGEFAALLVVAQIMLEVRNKEDFDARRAGYSIENPFYLDHISEIYLFEKISNVDSANTEKALKIVTEIFGSIVKLHSKSSEAIFEYETSFSLYDADIFKIDFNRGVVSPREDVENLVVTIKQLVEKTIGKSCGEETKAKSLLEIINAIPENRLVWRLKLFALAQCPVVFKEEIKNAIFRVFQPEVGERYFEITGGAEYEQVLVRCFNILEEADQRAYVEKVFEYFGDTTLEDKEKEKWRNREGGKILCFIHNSLTPEEKIEAKKVFNVVPGEVECVPEPISSGVRSWICKS